jgi:hypothetical protein
MSTFHKKQKAELHSFGLSDEQIAECESLFKSTPMRLDISGVKKAAKLLAQASDAIAKIENNDPRFYDEIATQLEDICTWQPDTLAQLSEKLTEVVNHQDGIHLSETDPDTGESVNRVTRPKSKNYYRYDGLTHLWRRWGNEINTNDSSEFLSFLTICIEGRYTIDGSNRMRTHYKRYYQGIKVDNEGGDLWELEVTMKPQDGEPSKIIKSELSTPPRHRLADDVKQLMEKRN